MVEAWGADSPSPSSYLSNARRVPYSTVIESKRADVSASSSIVRFQRNLMLWQVKLTEAADQRADKYSGGMRRRLTVAIALIGRPKVVFMDEPTTGLHHPPL